MKCNWVLRNKTPHPLDVLVPLNWKFCASHHLLPGAEVVVETDPDQVDIRAPLGTVGVLERKGKLLVQEKGQTSPAIKDPKPKEAPVIVLPPPALESDPAPSRRKRDEK